MPAQEHAFPVAPGEAMRYRVEGGEWSLERLTTPEKACPAIDAEPDEGRLRPSMARASRKPAPAPRTLPGTVYVTRQVHFNAAHRLHNPDKSVAWNKQTFGPCNNAKWHGHNYVLEVTVAGQMDPQTGYVVDLGDLKAVLEKRILRDCDHRNLNEEVPWLHGLIPSAENLAIAFWRRLESVLPAGRLHRVRLYETPRNFVDFYGETGTST